MKNLLVVIGVVLSLSGCMNTKSVDVVSDTKISDPKVIAMSGSRGPWVYEIEKRLRSKGFQIKRMASQNSAIEQVSDTKQTIYKEASANYILHIDGDASNDPMQRCFGGGYTFSHIDVELVDIVKNETVFHYSNSGFSEGCFPMSGTIFGDIAELTNNSWQ
ncbi:MAG: hypothetical protein IPN27_00105 [Cellvibrionales bacterium]|nr:hypothetical protein [Cellvibrionales bacterium]